MPFAVSRTFITAGLDKNWVTLLAEFTAWVKCGDGALHGRLSGGDLEILRLVGFR